MNTDDIEKVAEPNYPNAVIEENGHSVPFTFCMHKENVDLFNKLSNNLITLNKTPIDINTFINETLKDALTSLLRKNIHPEETTEYMNKRHVDYPEVGDIWSERPGTHYLRVILVISENDFVVQTWHELAGLRPGTYRINRHLLRRMVCYKYQETELDKQGLSVLRFIADVRQLCKTSNFYLNLTTPEAVAYSMEHHNDVR